MAQQQREQLFWLKTYWHNRNLAQARLYGRPIWDRNKSGLEYWVQKVHVLCVRRPEVRWVGQTVLWNTALLHTRPRVLCQGFLSNFVMFLTRHWDHIRDQVRILGVQARYGKQKLWRPVEEESHCFLKWYVGQMSIPTDQGISAALTQCISSSHKAELRFQR